MLDWVEKTVSPESSVTAIKIKMEPIKPGVKRKGTFGMDVYLDPSGGTNVARAISWATLAPTAQQFIDDKVVAGPVSTSEAKPSGDGMLIHVEIPFVQK